MSSATIASAIEKKREIVDRPKSTSSLGSSGTLSPWEAKRQDLRLPSIGELAMATAAGGQEEEDDDQELGLEIGHDTDSKATTTRSKVRAPLFTINITWSRSNLHVLQLVIKARKQWTTIQTPCTKQCKGGVVWVVQKDDLDERLPHLKDRQWISKIPGLAEMTKKVPTAVALNKWKEQYPEEFGFWPRTWIMPEEANTLDTFLAKQKKKLGTFIFKPNDGAQGDGIFLLQSRGDLSRRLSSFGHSGDQAIVQKYMPTPLLLDGYKFDMRLYVLVMSLSPLKVYLCHEGIIRVCTQLYEPPVGRNLHKTSSHLTNYSLNKTNSTFIHNADPQADVGSKRTLSVLLRRLKAQGLDSEGLWENLKDLVLKTVLALATDLMETQECNYPNLRDLTTDGDEGPRAFSIMGVDVLLDDQLNPHLLEVNNNPSMCIDTVWPTDSPDLPQLPTPPPKTCKCMQHYKPHVHLTCPVDVAAKGQAVDGALAMVRRERTAPGRSPEEMAEGLPYEYCEPQGVFVGLVEAL